MAKLRTIQECQDALALSRSSILRLIARGELRVIRPTGRAVRITDDELERFVRERQAEATAAR